MDQLARSATEPRQPKYQRIRDHLYGEIRSGRFAPGQSLPTEAKLAELLGISRNTIRQALGELEEEGMVERVQGRGTFVTTEQQRQSREKLGVFALISDELHSGFYVSLVHGFERGCAKAHQQMLLGNSGNELARQGDLILQMIDKNVAGVAIVPVTNEATPAYHIRQLQKHCIPVVFCHRAVKDISAPCVTWIGSDVGRLAGEAFVKAGHRRIAALFPHPGEFGDAYLRGLNEAVSLGGASNGVVESRYYGSLLPGSHAAEAIRSALADLMTGKKRPTALFCGSLPDAEQVYLLTPSLGLRIPEDLSLIVFCGTQRESALSQRITCIGVAEHEVGACAARLLAEIHAGERPLDSDERMVLPVALLPGETVGAPSAQ